MMVYHAFSLRFYLPMVYVGMARVKSHVIHVRNTLKPFGHHGYLHNTQKLMYDILTPSIIHTYKFLWTYGGSGYIYNIYYARGLLRVKTRRECLAMPSKYTKIIAHRPLSTYIYSMPKSQI